MGQNQAGDRESPGQHLGRRILEVLHKQRTDYTEDDIACLRRVISDIHRYRAQQRSARMNWSHDPKGN